MSLNNSKFKQTPIGLIPNEWEVKKLEDVAIIDNESLKSTTELDYEFDYISLSDIDSDFFQIETTKQIFKNAPSRARRIVRKGDILMSTVRPNLKGFSIINKEVKDLIASTGFAVITANSCNNNYLFQYIFSNPIQKQFYNLIVGSNYPAINSSDVKRLKIPIPPLPEQLKIASILSTWDVAIDHCKAIIEKLKERNKGLEQQLLTGKIRVKGFEETKWKLTPLSECLTFTPREVQKPTGNYLSLGLRSHGKGIFHKHDIDPEDVAMDVLYEVKENDLIVNITFAWEQALAIVSKHDEGGLVSHRFPTYTFKTDTAIPDFFRHFIVQKYFKFLMELISPGGAGRNRVLSKTDFLKLEIKLPYVKEQKAIANILDTAKTELNQYQQKLHSMQLQKNGLMQQLLTGKTRVKIK